MKWKGKKKIKEFKRIVQNFIDIETETYKDDIIMVEFYDIEVLNSLKNYMFFSYLIGRIRFKFGRSIAIYYNPRYLTPHGLYLRFES